MARSQGDSTCMFDDEHDTLSDNSYEFDGFVVPDDCFDSDYDSCSDEDNADDDGNDPTIEMSTNLPGRIPCSDDPDVADGPMAGLRRHGNDDEGYTSDQVRGLC
jgi:hypothetical protein